MEKKGRWVDLQLEVRSRISCLQNILGDILIRNEQRQSFTLKDSNEKARLSANWLTIVASIFLPLTLGTSLLSMNTRPAELGALWYDWVGICLIVGFTILVAYYTFQAIETFRVSIGPDIVRFKWFMKGDFLFKPNSVTFFVLRWFSTLLALEALVVLVSFLISIFKDMKLGLQVLRYSVSGVAAILALLVVYILIRLIWEVSKHRKWWLLAMAVKAFFQGYRKKISRRKEEKKLEKRREMAARRAVFVDGLLGRRPLRRANRAHGPP